jgi:Tfp pilus assembly protein PilZ
MYYERRRAFKARVSFSHKVYLTYNGKLHELHTRNLSEGGVYIKTKEPFPVGAEVEIRLLVETVGDIRMKGVVVHIHCPLDETPEHPSGFGIAFKEIKNGPQWPFRHFIEKVRS